MALGGGTWVTQNKSLPGAYINFVSAANANTILSDRGIVAMPITIGWGVDDAVFAVSNEDFKENSLKLLGYSIDAPELAALRDLFLNIKKAYLYKANTGGAKAENTYCTAKYKGTRGNQIKTVILADETSTVENPVYVVQTYFAGVLVDEQKSILAATGLVANDYCDWKTSATLELTAGTTCLGGTDGEATAASYQAFLSSIESYSFNVIGYPGTTASIKALFAAWAKRMRDEIGLKFQLVLHQYATADHEGIISVENNITGEALGSTTAKLVYWVAGAEAGCAVNKSLNNARYNGEFDIDANYSQTQLEDAIAAGKFIFHKVNDKVHVLSDINTFTSATDQKKIDFAKNQVVRVLDQLGNDIAYLFTTKYLGNIPNDNAGRISLWNDIVKLHQELARIRAIEAFDAGNVSVEKGDARDAVVITDYVTPIFAMEKLYMTIIVK